MRILFVKDSLAWPRVSGHDVHSYHMLRTLAELGHEVFLTSRSSPSVAAVQGLELQGTYSWDAKEATTPSLTRWQEKFRSYWGIENSSIAAIAKQSEELDADAVVAVGLEVLPLLAGIKRATRVWYAADEWVWHHLSVVQLTRPGTWSHTREAVIKGLYEYTFRTVVDRAWVVSAVDCRAMRWIAGIKQVDVIPNGVDADHFSPRPVPEAPRSCVFWGRLDFEPNIQALQWFCKRVWPQVVARVPDACFKILGFAPVPEVLELIKQPGVMLLENLPDLRDEIARAEVVVLPMQSGGGIKNKLLEAAAMAKPVLCSQRACNGLNLGDSKPLQVARNPQQWVDGLMSLWSSSIDRQMLGIAAREWVVNAHSWRTTAERAVQPLQPRSLPRRAVAVTSDTPAHAYAE